MIQKTKSRSVFLLRGLPHPAQPHLLLRPTLVIGAAVLALGISASTRKEGFRERGLPADLPHYLGQLKALKVPAEVTSLDWIPASLRELDASGTEVEDIPFVPKGMERLDLHAAKNLDKPPRLPASLRELDIRFTQLVGPWKFPRGIETLSLGGDRVETLEGLRELHLLELTLEDVPNLQSTSGLPTSLQALSISGATFSQVVEIPPQLKELRLENTQVRTLNGLPGSLQSIVLISNGIIEAELPSSLLSLSVGGRQKLSPFDALVSLNRLSLKEWVPVKAFPVFVRDLHIPTARHGMKLPAGLRRLEIEQSGGQLSSKLPAALETLRCPDLWDLSRLPAGLKHLSIPSSPLMDLSGLPRDIRLESLDVSLTGIGVDKLPTSLLSLRHRFHGSRSISGLPRNLRNLDLKGSGNVRVLQALPPLLERLDVSQTSIKKLPALPDTLFDLDISNTPIDDLHDLRGLRRLRRLVVHVGQLKSLAGMPETVSELRFVRKE